jgi:hypothetical protein
VSQPFLSRSSRRGGVMLQQHGAYLTYNVCMATSSAGSRPWCILKARRLPHQRVYHNATSVSSPTLHIAPNAAPTYCIAVPPCLSTLKTSLLNPAQDLQNPSTVCSNGFATRYSSITTNARLAPWAHQRQLYLASAAIAFLALTAYLHNPVFQ